jgi:hypothetical protein
MNKYSCKNLTSAILDLQTLLPRVDLAINSFKPEDGVLAKDEAFEIFQQYLLRIFFDRETYEYLLSVFGSEERIKEALANIETKGKSGSQLKVELESYDFRMAFKKEAYDHFMKVLGSEEELRRRVVSIETTGKTGEQLEIELKEQGVKLQYDAGLMFRSKDFQVAEAGDVFMVVKIEVGLLIPDGKNHDAGEVIVRASELGLGVLPHEIAADVFLHEKNWLKEKESYVIHSEPIRNRNGYDSIFSVSTADVGDYEGLSIGTQRATPIRRVGVNNGYMFAVRKLEKLAGKE